MTFLPVCKGDHPSQVRGTVGVTMVTRKEGLYGVAYVKREDRGFSTGHLAHD